MESKANYTAVGLFVVVLGLALIMAVFWLSSGFPHKKYKTYLLYLDESVIGLSLRSSVRFNGVDVGYVEDIELNYQDLQQVKLTLKIESAVPITTATIGALYLQGVTGVTYIGLRTTKPQAPGLTAKPGEKYPLIAGEASFLVTLEDSLVEVTEGIHSISDSLGAILNGNNAEKLASTIDNVEAFSQALSSRSEEITTIIDNLSQAGQQLPEVLEKANNTFSALDQATNSLAITMNSGQTAIQNLSDQAVPSLIELLNRLSVISQNLEQMSNEFNTNPSVIVRGKVSGSLGPGER